MAKEKVRNINDVLLDFRRVDVLEERLKGLSDELLVDMISSVSGKLTDSLSNERFEERDQYLISAIMERLNKIDPEGKLDKNKYLLEVSRLLSKEMSDIKNAYAFIVNIVNTGVDTLGIAGTNEGKLLNLLFTDTILGKSGFKEYNESNESKFFVHIEKMMKNDLDIIKSKEKLAEKKRIEEATRKREQEELDKYNEKLVEENAKPKDYTNNPLYTEHLKKKEEQKAKEFDRTDLPSTVTGEEYLRNAEVIRNMTGLSDMDIAIAAKRISRMGDLGSMEPNPLMDGARIALLDDRKFRIDGSEIVIKVINTSKNDVILMFPTGETTVINSMIAEDKDIEREKLEVQYLMYDETNPKASFIVLGSFEYPMPIAGCPPVPITQIGALAFVSDKHKEYILTKYKHDVNGLFADTFEYLRNGESEEFGFRENLLNLSPIHNVFMIRSDNIIKIPKASAKTRMKLIQKYLGNRPIDNDTVIVINLQFSKEDFKWDSLGPDGLRPDNAYPLMNNSYVPSIYIERIPIGENEKPLPEGLIGYDSKTGNTYYTNYRTANEYLNKYKTGNYKEVEEFKTKEKIEKEIKEKEEEAKKISYKVKEYVSNDDFKRNATFIGTVGAVALLIYMKNARGKDDELKLASYKFVQHANALTMKYNNTDLITFLGKFRIDTSRDDELIKSIYKHFSLVDISKAFNKYKQFITDLGKKELKLFKKPTIFNKIVNNMNKIQGVFIRKVKKEIINDKKVKKVVNSIIKRPNPVNFNGNLAKSGKKVARSLVKSFDSVKSNFASLYRELRKRLATVKARTKRASWCFTRVNRANATEVLAKTKGGFFSRAFGFLKSKLMGLGRLVLRAIHVI